MAPVVLIAPVPTRYYAHDARSAAEGWSSLARGQAGLRAEHLRDASRAYTVLGEMIAELPDGIEIDEKADRLAEARALVQDWRIEDALAAI